MAIAQQTNWLLLDEPTSALDLGYQLDVFQLIGDLARAGKTVVMVVHDIVNACRFADHMVAMREGEVISEGAPASIVTPGLVRRLFGIECTLLSDPGTGTPILTDLRRCPP